MTLFVGSNDHVAAIDASNGHTLWSTRLGGLLHSTSYEDVTVIDHGDHVFAGSQGHVYCLDAHTGALIWHNDLEGMGFNDVALAIGGRSVQVVSKVERR